MSLVVVTPEALSRDDIVVTMLRVRVRDPAGEAVRGVTADDSFNAARTAGQAILPTRVTAPELDRAIGQAAWFGAHGPQHALLITPEPRHLQADRLRQRLDDAEIDVGRSLRLQVRIAVNPMQHCQRWKLSVNTRSTAQASTGSEGQLACHPRR